LRKLLRAGRSIKGQQALHQVRLAFLLKTFQRVRDRLKDFASEAAL